MTAVLIRGSGDIGSAIAHRLFRAGYRVALHDEPRPPHARRGMAFTDSFYEGRCELEGVVAKHARDLEGLARMLECGHAVPACDADLSSVLEVANPDVLVDARMHKHRVPDLQIGLAPLTIGLGPNFEAGRHADVVVETAWGDDLGRVIRTGRARDLAGEPRMIAGHARGRYVYASAEGFFATALAIGAAVTAGELVASIGDLMIRAPLSGVLRGLTHDGSHVGFGTKVLEIDPRGDPDAVFGIDERPGAIASGVVRAVEEACIGA